MPADAEDAGPTKKNEVAKPPDGGDGKALAPTGRSTRAQKKQLLREAKERLAEWSFFAAHDPGEPIRIVVEGDSIGATSGDGEAIGTMILRASKLLRAFGTTPMLEQLQFGSSVELEFRAPETEVTSATNKLAEARRLAAAAGPSPTPEQSKEIDLTLGGAVTSILVAAQAASDLVSVPSQDAAEAAVAYGTQVAEAYKTLASAVAKADVTLTIDVPDHEPVQLTAPKALRVAEELREATETIEQEITAFGVLSIADQEQHGFGLRLDPDARRHPFLRRKRVVHGTYLPAIEHQIREQGLWGNEVRATLLVVRDPIVSTSSIRPQRFVLRAVEPRFK